MSPTPRTDLQANGGIRLIYRPIGADGAVAPEDLATRVQARVVTAGYGHAQVEPRADGTVMVEIAGNPDMDTVRRVITARGDFTIVPLPPARFGTIEQPQPSLPRHGDPVDPALPALVRSSDIDRHSVRLVPGSRDVEFHLTRRGAQALAEFTVGHTGEFMALVVDDVIISVPVIQSPIVDGRVQLSGAGEAQARELAAVLGTAEMPKLEEIAAEHVSPVP